MKENKPNGLGCVDHAQEDGVRADLSAGTTHPALLPMLFERGGMQVSDLLFYLLVGK